MNSDTLDLACELISRRSVTPDDAGCQQLLRARLEESGFEARFLNFGEVTNLWVRHGSGRPLLVFAGHTDVVPPGPETEWSSPPFTPTIRDGHLYGRGAADMKGSVAAMVVACERFVAKHPDHNGSLALLLTSDEEGPAIDGTARVVDALSDEGEQIDWCLVGEPSSDQELGDVAKVGRRGSLNARLRVNGTQGHVAYPHRVRNPIHEFAPALAELAATRWDEGSEFFPPTSFQVSNLNAGTGADNVVPGSLECWFNFRYSTALTPQTIQERVDSILRTHALDFEVSWKESGRPFLTQDGALVKATVKATESVTGLRPKLSTAGGTSDGRFIAPTGSEVVELGPVNESIHKINENVRVADLEHLAQVYASIMMELLPDSDAT